MKKIFYLSFGISILFSCNTRTKKIHHSCTVTSFEEQKKYSIHDEMSRTKYTVGTSCGDRKFIVYRKYNIGDTITLTEVILEKD